MNGATNKNIDVIAMYLAAYGFIQPGNNTVTDASIRKIARWADDCRVMRRDRDGVDIIVVLATNDSPSNFISVKNTFFYDSVGMMLVHGNVMLKLKSLGRFYHEITGMPVIVDNDPSEIRLLQHKISKLRADLVETMDGLTPEQLESHPSPDGMFDRHVANVTRDIDRFTVMLNKLLSSPARKLADGIKDAMLPRLP